MIKIILSVLLNLGWIYLVYNGYEYNNVNYLNLFQFTLWLFLFIKLLATWYSFIPPNKSLSQLNDDVLVLTNRYNVIKLLSIKPIKYILLSLRWSLIFLCAYYGNYLSSIILITLNILTFIEVENIKSCLKKLNLELN